MDFATVLKFYAVLGLLCVIFSFVTWTQTGGARTRGVKLFGVKQTAGQWQNWLLAAFVAFTLFPPIYYIAEWYFLLERQLPSNLLVYEHKLFNDLWTAFGVVLGALGIFHKP
jgi:hypothetical protein